MSLTDPKPELVAAIVRDAGGEIVGWFRLHRTAYLLEAAGLGSGFRFFAEAEVHTVPVSTTAPWSACIWAN